MAYKFSKTVEVPSKEFPEVIYTFRRFTSKARLDLKAAMADSAREISRVLSEIERLESTIPVEFRKRNEDGSEEWLPGSHVNIQADLYSLNEQYNVAALAVRKAYLDVFLVEIDGLEVDEVPIVDVRDRSDWPDGMEAEIESIIRNGTELRPEQVKNS